MTLKKQREIQWGDGFYGTRKPPIGYVKGDALQCYYPDINSWKDTPMPIWFRSSMYRLPANHIFYQQIDIEKHWDTIRLELLQRGIYAPEEYPEKKIVNEEYIPQLKAFYRGQGCGMNISKPLSFTDMTYILGIIALENFNKSKLQPEASSHSDEPQEASKILARGLAKMKEDSR